MVIIMDKKAAQKEDGSTILDMVDIGDYAFDEQDYWDDEDDDDGGASVLYLDHPVNDKARAC